LATHLSPGCSLHHCQPLLLVALHSHFGLKCHDCVSAESHTPSNPLSNKLAQEKWCHKLLPAILKQILLVRRMVPSLLGLEGPPEELDCLLSTTVKDRRGSMRMIKPSWMTTSISSVLAWQLPLYYLLLALLPAHLAYVIGTCRRFCPATNRLHDIRTWKFNKVTKD
jgi:hypothetical protein